MPGKQASIMRSYLKLSWHTTWHDGPVLRPLPCTVHQKAFK